MSDTSKNRDVGLHVDVDVEFFIVYFSFKVDPSMIGKFSDLPLSSRTQRGRTYNLV